MGCGSSYGGSEWYIGWDNFEITGPTSVCTTSFSTGPTPTPTPTPRPSSPAVISVSSSSTVVSASSSAIISAASSSAVPVSSSAVIPVSSSAVIGVSPSSSAAVVLLPVALHALAHARLLVPLVPCVLHRQLTSLFPHRVLLVLAHAGLTAQRQPLLCQLPHCQ